MLILALDTSGAAASCALARDGEVTAFATQTLKVSHSCTLLPMCEELLAKQGTAFTDIDGFAVTVGPGSFTGLRIGIAAVKGFAWLQDKPCFGVSTMLSAAYACGKEGVICAAVRARPDEYYTAFFKSEGGAITRLCADSIKSGAEVCAQAESLGGKIWLCGEGSTEFCGPFEQTGNAQSARGTALAAYRAQSVSCHLLAPAYMKPSQAERMKNERTAL